MRTESDLEIFLVAVPGTETLLRAEAVEKGFRKPRVEDGGVMVRGAWPDVWRANLQLRGASRVLVRLGTFRVTHLAQLDQRARGFPWGKTLRADVAVRVDVSCKKSRIYHDKAAAERIAKAITQELGAPVTDDGEVRVMARIVRDVCTLSIDTSGEGLHKRGHKQAVNKAPMRETLASLMLRQCGYKGKEPVLDPMCGSGTFVIEAAEIASRLDPGRSRTFAFEHLMTFDRQAWADLKQAANPITPALRFYGSDRDPGAVRMSQANAERAGVVDVCSFSTCPVEKLVRPEGAPGLVIVNPPYGARIGDMKQLKTLYRSLGLKLSSEFSGWRVGVVTNNENLAQATGLAFTTASEPISHGGLRIKAYGTATLP